MPPIINPVDASRLATEQLTQAIARLDQHVMALQSPTLASYISREQRSNEMGQEGLVLPPGARSVDPSTMEQKGISQATGAPALPPAGEEGQHASDPNRTFQQGVENRGFGGRGEQQIIRGMPNAETARIKQEQLEVPQYQWRLDSILRTARDVAVKTGTSVEKDSEGNVIGISQREGPVGEFASKAAGGLDKALGLAAPIEGARAAMQRGYGKVMGHAYAGQEVGASLGYSPQSGIGGQYIMGIRNPLAALTSEAGQQGLGQKVQAIGSVLGGGISMEQAAGLRNALSAEGFSNQESGFLGLTTGGENENLANTLEGVTKEGVNPNIAAGFANSVRYGSGTIHELQKALQGMGDTAKTLKFGINETAEAMQSYAKEMEGQGGTPIRSLEHFKEIAGATGLPPETIASINQSPVAVAIGASKGAFPGTLGSQSGPMQIETAIKAVNQMTAGGGHDVTEFNPRTGKMEVSQSAEEQALAKAIAVYGLHVSVPQLKAMKEHGDQMIASSHVIAQVKGQQDILAHLPGFHEEKLETEINNRKAFVKQADSEEKGSGSNSIQAEEIREKEKTLKGFKAHGLTDRERAEAKNNFYDLWTNKTTGETLDKETGISRAEFGKDYALDKGGPKALAALNKRLEEKSKIKTEQAEGKGVIDLSPRAKQFFELHFPNQAAENARAGGKSTASSAADVSQGKNAKGESFASEALHSSFGAASKAVKGDEVGAIEEFF